MVPDLTDTLWLRGIHVLMGDIDEDSGAEVVRWLLEGQTRQTPPERLQLVIHSAGGETTTAFAVCDAMASSRVPVHTLGLGLVASAGLLVLMAGAHRVVTPTTALLSHQWSGGYDGRQADLVAAGREVELQRRRMEAHYRRCTGLPVRRIRSELLGDADRWLAPEEAVELGIVDEVRRMY